MADVTWWQNFLKRIKFPSTGHFLIVPQEEPGEVELMHGETQQSVLVSLDEKETLTECAALFQKVLPDGKVAAPSGTSDTEAWWLGRI